MKKLLREYVLMYARPCDCCAAEKHVVYGTPLPKHLVRRRDKKLGVETIARRGSAHGDIEDLYIGLSYIGTN